MSLNTASANILSETSYINDKLNHANMYHVSSVSPEFLDAIQERFKEHFHGKRLDEKPFSNQNMDFLLDN